MAHDPLKYPKLRWPLNIRLESLPDQHVLLIECPVGITPEPLGLVPLVSPLLHLFDGRHSVEDIATQFQTQGATVDIIEQLIELLDKHYFLDTPRYDQENKRVRDTFREATVREAALAGRGYSTSATLLGAQLDDLLFHGSTLEIPLKGGMLGLMAPHIDYHRGGTAYGISYSSLRDEQHDLYILIGTSHQYSDKMFHLTRKNFDSPLGAAVCDTAFMDSLAELYGPERSYADEFLHRREHSLELQVPFLKRMKDTATIAPILVGGFYQMLQSDKPPSEFEEYETFASALAEVISGRLKREQSVCFIAGVDMAHVGQQFGDKDKLTPEKMQHIEERDQQYLDCIVAQDKEALFAHIAEDMDARRICGFPTMYTLIDVCDKLGIQYTAQLFDYQQAVDFNTECAVTFAGMGLYFSPIEAAS